MDKKDYKKNLNKIKSKIYYFLTDKKAVVAAIMLILSIIAVSTVFLKNEFESKNKKEVCKNEYVEMEDDNSLEHLETMTETQLDNLQENLTEMTTEDAVENKAGMTTEDAVENKVGMTTEDAAENKVGMTTEDSAKNKAGMTTENQSENKAGMTTEDAAENKTENKADDDIENNTNNQNLSNTGSIGEYYGKIKVSGNCLTDMSGNAIQLKGISTHGIAWFPEYINNECFKQLHTQFGANVIRLAMYTEEYNGYTSGGDKNYLKNLVKDGVKYATANNMYAIIDWHILSDGNPNAHIDEAKEFFAEMSSIYAENDNVIYEICNEPNGGTSWTEIKSYAIQIIDTIRQNDKSAVIIVGTPNWCQFINEAAGDRIEEENIMYALHFYAGTHKEDLRNQMMSAIQAGLPVFVSEFGTCDASGNGGFDENQANEWINVMNENKISYCMWSLSNKQETASLINSSCAKISGFSFEDLSESGKWFLNMMSGKINCDNNTSPGGNVNLEENINSAEDESEKINIQESNANKKIAVTANANLISSWQDGNNYFYQYEVSVKNNSGDNGKSWHTMIEFDDEISISNSWNGKFTVDGHKLYIESVDYNGTINNGQTITDVGVIIKSGVDCKIIS